MLCTEWTAQPKQKTTKRKVTLQQREEWYEEMKRNMKRNNDEYISAYPYIKAKSIAECESKIVHVSREMRARKLVHYAVLGIELANLKVMFIANKCDSCKDMEDDYEILDCKNCVSRKNKHVIEYTKKVKELIDCTHDYINFCIWIGRLYLKYDNFRYVTTSIAVIKNKLTIGFLSARMAEDAEFWRSK